MICECRVISRMFLCLQLSKSKIQTPYLPRLIVFFGFSFKNLIPRSLKSSFWCYAIDIPWTFSDPAYHPFYAFCCKTITLPTFIDMNLTKKLLNMVFFLFACFLGILIGRWNIDGIRGLLKIPEVDQTAIIICHIWNKFGVMNNRVTWQCNICLKLRILIRPNHGIFICDNTGITDIKLEPVRKRIEPATAVRHDTIPICLRGSPDKRIVSRRE